MTTLKESIRIHSPVDRVYALAEDPKRWANWFVGVSDKERLTDQERRDWSLHARSVSFGVQFPLVQRVLEDQLDAGGGRWRTKSNGVQELCTESPGQALVMLDSSQSWTYEPIDSGTEVTVKMQIRPPASARQQGALEEKIARLESGCLRQSLENLRVLCEGA